MLFVALQDFTLFSFVNGISTNVINVLGQQYKSHFGTEIWSYPYLFQQSIAKLFFVGNKFQVSNI